MSMEFLGTRRSRIVINAFGMLVVYDCYDCLFMLMIAYDCLFN